MSLFKNDIVYIIINTVDITIERKNMLKSGLNSDVDTFIKNNDGNKTIVTVLVHFADRFSGYQWFTKSEIHLELEKPEWQNNV